MKIIVTIIPSYLVRNLLLSCFFFFFISYKPKRRIWFSASWWSVNEKYLCFLFIARRALLQSHAEFNRLLQRNSHTCCSCSYYISMNTRGWIFGVCLVKNFEVFIRKHLCFSLFLRKLQAFRLASLLKWTLTQTFSCEYCENFKSTYFEKHLCTVASVSQRFSWVTPEV